MAFGRVLGCLLVIQVRQQYAIPNTSQSDNHYLYQAFISKVTG